MPLIDSEATTPRRPLVALPIPAYLPGESYGGPVRSASAVIRLLCDQLDFRVLAPDRDFGSSTPYPSVKHSLRQDVEGASVTYLTPLQCNPFNVARLTFKLRPDLIYLNSVFHPRFTLPILMGCKLLPRSRRPVILVSARGELHPAALALKGAKKATFLRFARFLGLFKGVCWNASSEEEANDISATVGASEEMIIVAPPLTEELQGHPFQPRREGGPLRLLFLSRISPKKNLHFLIQLLNETPLRVQLTIAGPEEDPAYVATCRHACAALPSSVQVRWVGSLSRTEIAAAMACHDALVLPTLGENYGHVIAEALLSGLPPIISDMTYFRGLEQAGAGWDLPLDEPQSWAKALNTIASLGDNDVLSLRRSAKSYGERLIGGDAPKNATKEMFRKILALR